MYLARVIIRQCTHSSLGWLVVVEILMAHGSLWEAQCECEDGLGRLPDDEGLRVALARVLARRGKLREAESELRDVVRRHPAHAAGAEALRGFVEGMELKEKGNKWYKEGEAERAAAAYTEALSRDVGGLLTPALLANRAQALCLVSGLHFLLLTLTLARMHTLSLFPRPLSLAMLCVAL